MQELRRMSQNYLAIIHIVAKLTTFGEGTQLTYSCQTIFHIQYVFVPKYDFFPSEIKPVYFTSYSSSTR